MARKRWTKKDLLKTFNQKKKISLLQSDVRPPKRQHFLDYGDGIYPRCAPRELDMPGVGSKTTVESDVLGEAIMAKYPLVTISVWAS